MHSALLFENAVKGAKHCSKTSTKWAVEKKIALYMHLLKKMQMIFKIWKSCIQTFEILKSIVTDFLITEQTPRAVGTRTFALKRGI